MPWLRRHAVLVGAVIGTVTLMTIAVLAMTGEVLSRVKEIDGERGGTLTVVSLEGAPDLDPARIDDVYGTMISRAVERTPYTFRPDRDPGLQPDLAEGTPEISDDSRQVTITIRFGVHFSPPVNREVTARDVAYGIARGFFPSVDSSAAHLYFGDVQGVAAVEAGRRTIPSGLLTPRRQHARDTPQQADGASGGRGADAPAGGAGPPRVRQPLRPAAALDLRATSGGHGSVSDRG